MNVFISPLTGALLVICSPWALAASSVDLNVKGSITPSACVHSLSDDGSVDFGKLPAKDLKVDISTQLPPVTLKLNITCEAPTLFALYGRDNRLGSAHFTLPHNYGLGLINGDQKLGSYGIGVFDPVADTPVSPLLSYDNGDTWLVNSSGSYMATNALNAFGDSPTPKALQNLAVDLRIIALIAASKNLDLTSEVPLDGSATIELRYL